MERRSFIYLSANDINDNSEDFIEQSFDYYNIPERISSSSDERAHHPQFCRCKSESSLDRESPDTKALDGSSSIPKDGIDGNNSTDFDKPQCDNFISEETPLGLDFKIELSFYKEELQRYYDTTKTLEEKYEQISYELNLMLQKHLRCVAERHSRALGSRRDLPQYSLERKQTQIFHRNSSLTTINSRSNSPVEQPKQNSNCCENRGQKVNRNFSQTLINDSILPTQHMQSYSHMSSSAEGEFYDTRSDSYAKSESRCDVINIPKIPKNLKKSHTYNKGGYHLISEPYNQNMIQKHICNESESDNSQKYSEPGSHIINSRCDIEYRHHDIDEKYYFNKIQRQHGRNEYEVHDINQSNDFHKDQHSESERHDTNKPYDIYKIQQPRRQNESGCHIINEQYDFNKIQKPHRRNKPGFHGLNEPIDLYKDQRSESEHCVTKKPCGDCNIQQPRTRNESRCHIINEQYDLNKIQKPHRRNEPVDHGINESIALQKDQECESGNQVANKPHDFYKIHQPRRQNETVCHDFNKNHKRNKGNESGDHGLNESKETFNDVQKKQKSVSEHHIINKHRQNKSSGCHDFSKTKRRHRQNESGDHGVNEPNELQKDQHSEYERHVTSKSYEKYKNQQSGTHNECGFHVTNKYDSNKIPNLLFQNESEKSKLHGHSNTGNNILNESYDHNNDNTENKQNEAGYHVIKNHIDNSHDPHKHNNIMNLETHSNSNHVVNNPYDHNSSQKPHGYKKLGKNVDQPYHINSSQELRRQKNNITQKTQSNTSKVIDEPYEFMNCNKPHIQNESGYYDISQPCHINSIQESHRQKNDVTLETLSSTRDCNHSHKPHVHNESGYSVINQPNHTNNSSESHREKNNVTLETQSNRSHVISEPVDLNNRNNETHRKKINMTPEMQSNTRDVINEPCDRNNCHKPHRHKKKLNLDTQSQSNIFINEPYDHNNTHKTHKHTECKYPVINGPHHHQPHRPHRHKKDVKLDLQSNLSHVINEPDDVANRHEPHAQNKFMNLETESNLSSSQFLELQTLISNLQEEQSECQAIIREQQTCIQDYHNRCIQAQCIMQRQQIELENLNDVNQQLEHEISSGIEELRSKIDLRLRDLALLPQIVRNEQKKYDRASKTNSLLISRLITLQGEVAKLKMKIEEVSRRKLNTVNRLKIAERDLNIFKNYNTALKHEKKKLLEELQKIREQLNSVQTISKRTFARHREKTEKQKRELHKRVMELEIKLSRSQDSARGLLQERDNLITELQGQLNALVHNFEVSQKHIRVLRRHIYEITDRQPFKD